MSVDPLLDVLGQEFVDYISAVDHPAQGQVPASSLKRAEAVQEAVRVWGDELQAEYPQPHDRLARFVEEFGTSLPNELRRRCGGDLPDPQSDDPALRPLLQIARDVFPALLLPPRRSAFPGVAPIPAYSLVVAAAAAHPARAAFDSAVEDDVLAGLFTDWTASPPAGFMYLSDGSGGLIQLDGLSWALVGTAAYLVDLSCSVLSAQALFDELAAVVGRLRRLVLGEEVDLPALIAFSGVGMDAGLEAVSLPWGDLQRVRPHSAGATASGDLMIVAPVPIRLAVVEPGQSPTPPSEFQRLSRQLSDLLNDLSYKTILTALLAIEREPAAAMLWTWSSVVGPLHAQGSGASGSAVHPLFGIQASLGAGDTPAVEKWGALVNEHYGPRLETPTRRITLALTSRHDAADALVDAVIAWESLFAGSEQGELVFRISASMACLLEDLRERRPQLQREIKKIYGDRSKIVHGAPNPPAAVVESRRRAAELGIASLRRLILNFPALIDDDNRSSSLLLGLAESRTHERAASAD